MCVSQIDLDNEENIRKKPAKQNKKATKCAPKTDSDSDLDLDYAPVITRYGNTLSIPLPVSCPFAHTQRAELGGYHVARVVYATLCS